jgi:hypothetical protein
MLRNAVSAEGGAILSNNPRYAELAQSSARRKRTETGFFVERSTNMRGLPSVHRTYRANWLPPFLLAQLEEICELTSVERKFGGIQVRFASLSRLPGEVTTLLFRVKMIAK